MWVDELMMANVMVKDGQCWCERVLPPRSRSEKWTARTLLVDNAYRMVDDG